MKVLVAGASGFVGRRLCPGLEAGAATRPGDDPPSRHLRGVRAPRSTATCTTPDSLAAALAGCDAAYYLVHSLGDADFERLDAEAARAFAAGRRRGRAWSRSSTSAASATTTTSCPPHLRSRREVEGLLGAGPAYRSPCCAPAIIIGHGGISWEITRQLVEHLPAMITPRWVRTRTQPIAVDDVVRYLVGVLEPARGAVGRTFEIGGPTSWSTST